MVELHYHVHQSAGNDHYLFRGLAFEHFLHIGVGQCDVLDGRLVCSCLMLGVEAEGVSITTVEGVAQGDKLHPVQQAFSECHALQCGFCTPGMIMAVAGLLKDTPKPTDDQIIEGLEGNLCRCTGYVNIIKAVKAASAAMA